MDAGEVNTSIIDSKRRLPYLLHFSDRISLREELRTERVASRCRYPMHGNRYVDRVHSAALFGFPRIAVSGV